MTVYQDDHNHLIKCYGTLPEKANIDPINGKLNIYLGIPGNIDQGNGCIYHTHIWHLIKTIK
jgi:hypothetical protein